MVSEKKIFSYFSHYKPMLDNNAPGVANMGPRDTVGRIYEGGYQTLILIKHLSSGSHGFRKDFF